MNKHAERTDSRWGRKALYRLLAGVALLSGLTTSCTLSDLDGDAMNKPLKVNASIGEISTRATMDEVTGAGTFVTNDVIGLFVKPYGTTGSDGVWMNDVSYTFDGSLWKSTDTKKPLYWEQLGLTGPSTFYAYYPRSSSPLTSSRTYAFSVQSNQSTKTAYEASDLTWATTAAKETAVNLSFNHLMSRVVVNLKLDAGMEGDINEVKILGFKPACSVNLEDGTLTASGNATPIFPYLLPASAGYKATYAAVLPPQATVAAAPFLSLKAAAINNGSELTIPVPAKIRDESDNDVPFTALPAGKQVTLDITVSRVGVTLSASIAPWGTQGTAPMPVPPYPGIYTADDFSAFAVAMNKGTLSADDKKRFVTTVGDKDTVKVWNDIDLTKLTVGMTPFATVTKDFAMVFDGQGHTIQNLTGQAIFTTVSKGVVRNLRLKKGSASEGAITVTLSNNALIENCFISEYTITGNVAGGLVKTATTSTIRNSGTLGTDVVIGSSTVTGANGGLIATATGSTVVNCSFTGKVNLVAGAKGGHLVGTTSGGSISNSYSIGYSSMPQQITEGNATVENCYIANQLPLGFDFLHTYNQAVEDHNKITPNDWLFWTNDQITYLDTNNTAQVATLPVLKR